MFTISSLPEEKFKVLQTRALLRNSEFNEREQLERPSLFGKESATNEMAG